MDIDIVNWQRPTFARRKVQNTGLVHMLLILIHLEIISGRKFKPQKVDIHILWLQTRNRDAIFLSLHFTESMNYLSQRKRERSTFADCQSIHFLRLLLAQCVHDGSIIYLALTMCRTLYKVYVRSPSYCLGTAYQNETKHSTTSWALLWSKTVQGSK